MLEVGVVQGVTSNFSALQVGVADVPFLILCDEMIHLLVAVEFGELSLLGTKLFVGTSSSSGGTSMLYLLK